nr:chromatin modification-related protein EAF1 B-like isoform X1 [Malus domestica]XP_017187926.2 chromatin modification-related protein EAF1 B-like isoform X1 [Malus domestica]XP_028958333.1 chromatin modification-related protein EAF1 B-like isoform X1 [Malus domestica]XP_028958334.1 chromatin modification-related protein EAF1 B-like isoform X1 [Malus domestica]
MHGCSSGSALLVNAEVDSMGGVVDGGVGIGLKTSPRRAAIEKAQAELRQEYDVREERRKELEFLEKGGNPLDFKVGNGASVSVQSTSLTDQQPEQFVTSEAKGSFALTASTHGDSVESSGRPEVPTLCEPNSADNLLLFDADNDAPDGERNSMHLSRRNNNGPSEQSSQMDGTQNPKESEDSAIFRPYARRNRSRPNRDGTRSNSTDMQGRGGQGSSLPSRGLSKDPKRPISETNNQKDQNIPSGPNVKYVSSNGDIVPKIVTSDNQFDMDLEGVQAPEVITGPMKDGSQNKLDVTTLKSLTDSQHSQPSQIDAQETPIDVVSERSDVVADREPLASSVLECPPCAATTKTENELSSVQMNGYNNLNRESKSVPHEGQISSAALCPKGLDSESSCTQTSLGLDVNNDSDMCTTMRNADNGNIIESSDVDGTRNLAGGIMVQEDKETNAVDSGAIVNDNQASVCQNNSGNSEVKVEEDMSQSRSELHNEVKLHSNVEGEQPSDPLISEAVKKVDEALDSSSNINKENLSTGISQGPQDSSMHEVPGTVLSGKDTAAGSDCQTPRVHLKVVDKAHEDSILEKARIIEAKRKRIAELSVRSLPSENCRKSQWDFVLEEMAWLANDFAQERLWKLTAAAQICHRAAFTSRLRIESQHQHWELKKVAHDLAKAVNQFWVSAETLLKGDDSSSCQRDCNYDLVGSMRIDRNKTSQDKNGEPNMEPSKDLEPQHPQKDLALSVREYAVRFLKYNKSLGPDLQAQAPATPERISDLGITEMSWEDHLTEENLFYAVPSGAMETYRKLIESHLVQFERTGSSMQEEVETSMYDAGAEFGFQEAAYDEDEGETSTYYLPGAFEGSKSLKSNLKKQKNLKLYASRSYEGADLPYGNCTTATHQSMLMGKRPASLNVGSIPTKRMRTASRQRVVSPFGAGANGNVLGPIKTDASSGDTNSFQDDQSTLHGGSQFQKSVEVESVGDFEKQLPYDYAETSMKPKKKKKAKHLGSAYDQGWQLDSAILNEQQRDHSKKRSEGHHYESNGTIGLYGQHTAKKPKILKQSLDNTYDSITPMPGSNPSPVASQMSNMSNTSKFIKLIGGRDRGRKTKSLKMSTGQPGSGGPWSLFEDQALVVLVHDMGPNWEFISDAINSTLHLKCIFRKPKECKERHKILMDMNSGDGADSAEDSGSSQPYPSTIPGIPKGSARQLFQRLQEPMEEDVLKSHFEKIINIGQKHHYRRSQNENQDPKQITTVHNSHVVALSQVSPNNLNGGVLTPLDLCDTTSSSSDVLGYQGSHASGLAMSNQGAMASLLPSGPNASIQGSSGMVLGSNLPSSSGPLSANVRDGRYSSPRTSSLPVDEQQRHYNQMLSGRNIQQSGLSVPGALPGTDRGVRMVPGGNGMGMMCGINRGMPVSRPGFQGMASSSMLNSGNMLSSSMVGIPSPVNMHSGAGSGQGNLMLRPRDALHMMRPGHNPEHQRQLMVPELQMQATQGNGQGVAPFNGLSSGFPNQQTPPSAQTYPGHSPQQRQISPQQSHALSNPHHPHLQGPNHATGSQHQAYAFHVAKERQLQQRYLQQQQQQQQFSTSNSLVPQVQPQAQLPMSSTLQNSSQLQSQTSPHPVSVSPMTPSSPRTPMSSQHQQKHHLPSHGFSRNPGASGMTNQIGKQRQRQPQQHHLQQSGRHHPQQRQLTQSQQQAKLSKGMGRANSMVHQNLSIDPANLSIDSSQLNGLVPPGSQSLENGEQFMQLMQGQGAYSGSALNPATSKPLVPQSPNHSQLQQKLLSSAPTNSSKHLQQMPSHSDNITQGQVPPVPSNHTISASHQTGSPSGIASNHQQLQPQSQAQQQQKQANQTQPYVQRVLQQNHQVNLEIPNKSQNDLTQGDEQPVNGASPVGVSTAIPQSCIDSSSLVPVPSAIPQWKSSEAVYDANMPNSTAQVGPVGSPPLTNSSGNEPGPPISQGLGPRRLSGNLLSHGLNVGAQWQQQQLLQRSPSLPSPSQQHYQQQEQQQQQQEQESPQHQLPLQQQSQQQMQHLQAGQGSLYTMSGNSKPE